MGNRAESSFARGRVDRRAAVLAGLTAMLCAGCGTTIGPQRLVSSHEGYNDAVQLVTAREVLKNVVRIRYLDPIQFVSVSAINASFSVTAGASVGGTFAATTTGTAGANVGFSDSPTITFLPVNGSDAMKSLESPIDLRYMLNYSFDLNQAEVEDFAAAFIAVNSAPDGEGPAGQMFRSRIDALAKLVRLGCRLSQRRVLYPRHQPFPAERIGGRAYVEAAASGLYFVDAGDGKLNLASKHILPGLFVPHPDDPEVIEQLRILDAEPGHDFYFLRPATQLHPPNSLWSKRPDGRLRASIYVIPRSVISLMSVASKSVEPPAAHEDSSIVPPLAAVAVNSSLKLSMRIRSSPTEPDDEYRIFHRGYWFFIEDRDYTGKRQFAQLVYSYSHTLGDKAPSVPTLTLPIGGR